MTAPDTAAIDRLVPPPWPGPRRTAVTSLAVLLAAALTAAWWLGLLGPHLAPVAGYGFGAVADPREADAAIAALPTAAEPAARARGIDGVVELDLQIRNRGVLPVRDLRIAAPVEQLVQQEPVDVPARGEATVRLHLIVHCDGPPPPSFVGLHHTSASGPFRAEGQGLRVLDAEHTGPEGGATGAWYGPQAAVDNSGGCGLHSRCATPSDARTPTALTPWTPQVAARTVRRARPALRGRRRSAAGGAPGWRCGPCGRAPGAGHPSRQRP